MDLLEQEIEQIKTHFDLDKVLSFQSSHDIQIIRDEEFLYNCCRNVL